MARRLAFGKPGLLETRTIPEVQAMRVVVCCWRPPRYSTAAVGLSQAVQSKLMP